MKNGFCEVWVGSYSGFGTKWRNRRLGGSGAEKNGIMDNEKWILRSVGWLLLRFRNKVEKQEAGRQRYRKEWNNGQWTMKFIIVYCSLFVVCCLLLNCKIPKG